MSLLNLCGSIIILVTFLHVGIEVEALSFANRFIHTIKPGKVEQVKPSQQAWKSRGTTVPTAEGSKRLVISTKYQDVLRIDPSDPYTFGFVRVGKIVGPHGVQGEVKVLLEPGTEEISDLAKLTTVYVKKPNRRSPRAVNVLQSRRQGARDDANILLLRLEGLMMRSIAEAFTNYELYIKLVDRSSLKKDEFLVRELVGLDCYHLRDMTAVTQFPAQGDKSTHPPAVVKEHTPLLSARCIGRVVGVVPPEELCDSPAVAKLMHAQLELQLAVHPPQERHGAQSVETFGETGNKHANKINRRGMKKGGSVEKDDSSEGASGSGSGSGSGRYMSNSPPGRTGNGPPQHCLIPMVPSIVHTVDLARRCVFLDLPSGLLELTYSVEERAGAVRGFLPASSASLSAADRAYLATRCASTTQVQGLVV